MIREPYGVNPYNVTIDLLTENNFSLIFSGDELESYQYEMIENNKGGLPNYQSEIIDEPTIYNEDTLSWIVGGSSFENLLDKNFLWRIFFWENNANIADSYKNITRSTTELEPTKIYLQDESSYFNGVNFSDKNRIINIIIRGERRRVLSYDTAENYIIVNKAFSFTPAYGSGYTDQYILYKNFTTANQVDYSATIPVITSVLLSENVGRKFETGVIPSLESITDSELLKFVVNLNFGSNHYRVQKYEKVEIYYDFVKKVIDENLFYTTTKTTETNHGGIISVETLSLGDIPADEISNYVDTVTAFCTIDRDPVIQEIAGTSFNILKNYYISNYYFFKSRLSASVTINNFPANLAQSFPSRYFKFVGSYYQSNNIPIKYHFWEIFDISKSKAIYSTDKIYNSNLIFEYDNFENYHTYHVKLTVVNQENATIEYLSPELIISYPTIDFKTSSEAIYNEKTYSVDVVWPDNRMSIPKLIKGLDGSFNFYFDAENKEKNNLYIPLNTQYKYDNLSGGNIVLDSTNFALSTFLGIKDITSQGWSGEILNLSSSSTGNRISLIKEGYKLRILSTDDSGSNIYYDFFQSEKVSEGNFLISSKKFSLLESTYGQQQGYLNGGTYYPLLVEDKIGKSYEWIETNLEDSITPIYWNDNYFWTETESNTDCYSYKLLIYPDRAEIYRLLRWTGTISAEDGLWLTVGKNAIFNLQKQKQIDIDDETRTILDFDPINNKILINSAFSEPVAGKTFLIYDITGFENATTQVWVCPFAKQNNMPFGSISLFGGVEYNYLTVYTKKNFSTTEMNDILTYNYVPQWTDENQSKILINCTFNNTLSSKYYDGIESEITGYRIYRNTYYSLSDTTPFESVLVAKVNNSDLAYINGTSLKITDYSVRNRGIFSYSVLPMTSTVIGARIESNKVKTDWYEWIFTSIGKVKDNIYKPLEQWVFKLNIEAGNMQHNVTKVFHNGFARFPKASIGHSNYMTTSLSCLVSDFNYNTIIESNYLIPLDSGTITKDTSDLNNRKIYIKDTSIFEGIDLVDKEAYIFINNQQRRINYFGNETIEGTIYSYILIEEPFKHFIPALNNPSTNSYVIYGNYMPSGTSQSGETISNFTTFDDSIERITAWNAFVATDNPILVKDMKGNIFIAELSDNQEQTDIRINDFPTTISFNITQIADISSYLVFLT